MEVQYGRPEGLYLHEKLGKNEAKIGEWNRELEENGVFWTFLLRFSLNWGTNKGNQT